VDAKRPPNFRPAVAAVDLFHEFSADRERDARDKTLGRTRESILIALFHSRSFSRRASRAPLGISSLTIGISRWISKKSASRGRLEGRWEIEG
jgi:hypothetical protein